MNTHVDQNFQQNVLLGKSSRKRSTKAYYEEIIDVYLGDDIFWN